MTRKRRKRKSGERASRRRRLAGPREKDRAALLPEIGVSEPGHSRADLRDRRSDDESPLLRAQELVYEAYRADDERQVALAHEALSICANCADAYVLLAEHAPNLDEAIELYQRGVAAGERALGEGFFREYGGEFWGMLETRPYMRARMRLAECLRAAGRQEEAAEHFQELLRLNPEDNQAARWHLAGCLLELGRDDRLERLLAKYEEDGTATWAYTKALLAFRRQGDGEEATRLLAEATRLNRHVPPYLLGDVPLPRRTSDSFSLGDDDEAVIYAIDFLSAWRSTPGAVSWLRKAAKVGLPKQQERRSAEIWSAARAALSGLPQVDGERWQADIRRLPATVDIDGRKLRPWAVLVIDCSSMEVPALDLSPERPSDEVLCELLLQAMLKPMTGEPHRPEVVQLSTKKRCRAWGSHLAAVGIDCTYCKPLEHVDRVLQQLEPFLPKRRDSRERPDTPAGSSDLWELPQNVGTTWQADVFRMPTWIEADGEPTRPWIIMVAECTSGLILSHDLLDQQPGPVALWERLCGAMGSPMVGQACRPGEVQLRSEDHRNAIGPHLEAIGVRCVVSDKLDELDIAFESLASHMAGSSPIPAMLDVPGVSPEQVGRYFEAAARFYQQAPWRRVLGDTPIKVECRKFQSGPWYAVVMGQSGMTVGLALYDDFETLCVLLSGRLSDEESLRRTSALSVTFDEEFAMAIADLEAAEQFGWPVATPEAYPCAMRVNPGKAVRPPLAWELELLEGCLRAIPEFLGEKDVSPQRITAPVASGDLELIISWPDDEDG